MTKENENSKPQTKTLTAVELRRRVSCPVCKGKKVSIYGSKNSCLCCGGEGVVTKRHDEVLSKISVDIKKKMTEKGLVS